MADAQADTALEFGPLAPVFIASFAICGDSFEGRKTLIISKNTPSREAAMISFIIPKGLAAAVLAEVPMHMGLPEALLPMFTEIRAVIYMVILFSILLTAFLIYTQETGLTTSGYERIFSKFDK